MTHPHHTHIEHKRHHHHNYHNDHHSDHKHSKRTMHKQPNKVQSTHACSESNQALPSGSVDNLSRQCEVMHNVSSKELTHELSSVQEELVETKRKLLKTLLHDERLQLLRKTQHADNMGEELTEKEQPLPLAGFMQTLPLLQGKTRHKSVDELTSELKSVEEAIKTGKKQVLRFSKRLELVQLSQNKGEQDDSCD